MAVNASDVFKDKELTLFLKLQKIIPVLFKPFNLTAEFICIVNSDNSPRYFYIGLEHEGKKNAVKLFASIELSEMAKKAFLVENIIILVTQQNKNLIDAFSELEKKDGIYAIIEREIEFLDVLTTVRHQNDITRLETIEIENMTVH